MIQSLSDALAERGYDNLTAVQEAVTDPELAEKDLLVSAQTGSGKTVGFGLAIGPTLLGDEQTFGPAGSPMALIVAPTRELAFQVMRELGWLYAKAGARVTSCVGGMDMRDERRALERGAHIVVGTPGRLRDHIQRGSLDLSAIRAIVLDEADEMLDLGFREDLEFMLGEAPEDRRTLLFSATVPPMIATLAKHYQRDAVRVTTLSDKGQHADITYQAVRVAQDDAEHAIINLLRYHEAENAIVFANTRAAVNRLTARFSNRGFAVVCLSGELSQSERTHALQAMRDGRARVCVATDVAARGIDLPNLDLVIHAELPSNTEGLLHRSGRTGRAGRKGISALIVPPKIVKRAERLLGWAKVKAEWITAPDADDILRRDEERLLNDPVWSEEISPEAAAFAERLLAQHAPEVVAAAYLKLYHAKHSAPEELSDPDARPAPKERAPFGPSVWFSLSVGRDDRAEPRWILPLLCRAGGLSKEHIGAIRVQQNETHVELAEPAVAGFLSTIGDDGVLEDGVTARRMPGAPEREAYSAPRPAPRRDRDRDAAPKREHRKGGAPRHEDAAPAAAPEANAEAAPSAPAAPEKPRAKLSARPAAETQDEPATRRVWGDKPARSDDRKPFRRSEDSDRKPFRRAEDGDRKPAFKRDRDGERPSDKGPRKPGPKRDGAKPFDRDGKPPFKKGPGKPGAGKPGAGKPYAGKPGGAGKPTGAGKPGGKPFKAKSEGFAKGDKPRGKPGAPGKGPGGKPAGKFGGKPRAGGMQPPRRPKS